ncbi:GNAT family N-acetyltransferase [Rhizobium sp. RCC_161_2]|uniref:bifunctional helix-turn-helix transcriptional regulator/GNAT family N-acetyltransferase n=1 Tax=Rhizobium sp. RCC_161_2 TaxID=3239219 RepID=UPI00352336F8
MTTQSHYPVESVRAASRQLVRELGFMQESLAGTTMPPSSVHALLEIGARGSFTAGQLSELLGLEKSSVSRMLRKLIETGDLKEETGEPDGRTKILSLTDKGHAAVAGIHDFARRQVAAALDRLDAQERQTVVDGLRLYAGALAASKAKTPEDMSPLLIETGYQPGLMARCIEMHSLYYARTSGFGQLFEAAVASGIAEFSARLNRPCNQIWRAMRAGRVAGTIAIDGEDLGDDKAHLRWFIVDDDSRGTGLGRRLLSSALDFCDRGGFAETHLWTFRGLDAARWLYELHRFELIGERPGRQWGEDVMEQHFVRKKP